MTVQYPDISSYQTGISLVGAVAACCKATEGTGYSNPDFGPAKQRASAVGCYFFGYHFRWHASEALLDQAEAVLRGAA
jgi:GH25 family lysozyme M1 (1,4-beta-N-acetylmuramidase)